MKHKATTSDGSLKKQESAKTYANEIHFFVSFETPIESIEKQPTEKKAKKRLSKKEREYEKRYQELLEAFS